MYDRSANFMLVNFKCLFLLFVILVFLGLCFYTSINLNKLSIMTACVFQRICNCLKRLSQNSSFPIRYLWRTESSIVFKPNTSKQFKCRGKYNNLDINMIFKDYINNDISSMFLCFFRRKQFYGIVNKYKF